MSTQDYDSSVSGYQVNDFEGISRNFTQIEVLFHSGHNILAKAKRYGRWWMLKTLQPEKNSQQIYCQMMRKELEILMSMQSPYTVQTTGVELVEGLGMCIVMEYIDGMRLDKWLSQKQGMEKRLRLAEELLRAADYIHSTGVVHRDLKPGNIMVTRNGEHLKLIDFGLADNDHLAILKQPAGTPGYTSPEQATVATPDIRNDIYSLGIILQQLLPERRYRSVINKCFLPLETRYRNANLLLKDLQKRAKRKQKIAIAIPIILTIFMAAVLVIQASKLHRQEEARNRIDNAIEEGIRKTDKVFEAIVLEEILDTCVNNEYIFQYYNEHSMDVDKAADIYFDSIRPLFTKIEMYEIINAVRTHCTERQTTILNKLYEKAEIYLEEIMEKAQTHHEETTLY